MAARGEDEHLEKESIMTDIDERLRELAGDVPIATFKLQVLDDLTGGVFPGRMTALGATPSAGAAEG